MNNKKKIYERKAYTLMNLLGDFGGFNDAIIFLVGSVLAFYASSMFAASISSEIPVIRRQKTRQSSLPTA